MISAWFVLGVLVGIAATEVTVVSVMKMGEHKLANEEFVKKLIKKEGWADARWELETSYGGKYIEIWRRLYRKHIEGENEND